jgi:HD superfamily phosphodiesterase
MNLTVSIESAELQFKQILEDFFIAVHDEKYLSSHGIDHHRRVWSYAKELLSLPGRQYKSQLSSLPSKLIIASYLHDIGMSVDSGPRHGKHSRELCIQFLAKNNLRETDYQDVLETIENHDIKDYAGGTGIIDLLTILSVADDLDAFGFIGIFRYSEIYLTRGISPSEIGHLIKENAGRRFDNFAKIFGFNCELVLKHRNRYDTLNNFLTEYNNQLSSYQFGGQNPSGYCGVMEILLNLVNSKITLKDLYKDQQKFSYDPVIQWFLNSLIAEEGR